MKAETKLLIRKRVLMTLRAILWHADEWLHRQEVALREELRGVSPARPEIPISVAGSTPAPRSETFQQWEARRSGIAVVSKKDARQRRRVSSAEFDLRFAR